MTIRFAIRRTFVRSVGVVVLAMAITNIALGQSTPKSESSPTQETVPTVNTPPAGPLTDADRIVRSETAIGEERKQLTDLEAELTKAQQEENSTVAVVLPLATKIDDTKKLLQAAKDSGNTSEVVKLNAALAEVEPRHKFASDQFNLAIETRKTIQEQIATLKQKIVKDQESLDKLKGLSEPSPPQPPTAVAAPTPAVSGAVPGPQQPQKPESNGPEQTTPEEVAVSQDLAKARDVVKDKATSLQDVENDLKALTESKALLEKSIELESEKLETARKKYDSSENARDVAENEFTKKVAAGIPTEEQQQLRKQIAELQQQISDQRAEIRSSTDRVQELGPQLLAVQAEELQFVKKIDELRGDVVAAQRSEWVLRIRDYLYTTVPKIVVILILTFLLWMFVKIFCGRSRAWVARTGPGEAAERSNRADTLAGVFQNTGNVAIAIGSVLMILDAAGVPITALLGGAGVVGLAVAFGAQSLIKDYFCGFILLLEGQYKVNDFVTIGGMSGSVERITLRMTVLRDFEGKVYFIPNGQVTAVTNATMDWARAVLDVNVAYKEDVDGVIEEIKQLTSELRTDDDYSDAIVGDIEMLGVDCLGDSSVVIKFGLKTRPDKKLLVKRELLRRIKNTFDARGIEIPFPHRTVIHRTENGSPSMMFDKPVVSAVDPIK